jgi:hypothetical protein
VAIPSGTILRTLLHLDAASNCSFQHKAAKMPKDVKQKSGLILGTNAGHVCLIISGNENHVEDM